MVAALTPNCLLSTSTLFLPAISASTASVRFLVLRRPGRPRRASSVCWVRLSSKIISLVGLGEISPAYPFDRLSEAGPGYQETATKNETFSSDGAMCVAKTTWSPAEPKVTYNDPNLP